MNSSCALVVVNDSIDAKYHHTTNVSALSEDLNPNFSTDIVEFTLWSILYIGVAGFLQRGFFLSRL